MDHMEDEEIIQLGHVPGTDPVGRRACCCGLFYAVTVGNASGCTGTVPQRLQCGLPYILSNQRHWEPF